MVGLASKCAARHDGQEFFVRPLAEPSIFALMDGRTRRYLRFDTDSNEFEVFQGVATAQEKFILEQTYS